MLTPVDLQITMPRSTFGGWPDSFTTVVAPARYETECDGAAGKATLEITNDASRTAAKDAQTLMFPLIAEKARSQLKLRIDWVSLSGVVPSVSVSRSDLHAGDDTFPG